MVVTGTASRPGAARFIPGRDVASVMEPSPTSRLLGANLMPNGGSPLQGATLSQSLLRIEVVTGGVRLVWTAPGGILTDVCHCRVSVIVTHGRNSAFCG